MYGLVIGSNLGANFTIIGSLAGIMWVQILKDKHIGMTYTQFAKVGFVLMPIVAFVAASVLALEFAIM
jgi:arsenical pump membrane protein